MRPGEFKDHFVPTPWVYFDGNSLGRMPKVAHARLAQFESEWGSHLITGWNEGWLEMPARVGAKIARLIGAEPDEVLVADNTSTNLYKLASAAMRHQEPKREILSDPTNFPSDLYVLASLGELRLEGEPDETTALVSHSHVAFRTGHQLPMAEWTARAHEAGALVLWDLSHSVGAIPVDLGGAGVDLAVGCGYKYLNGGPGAPAFLYVRRELQSKLLNPIQGWFGQDRPFDFDLDYRPAQGIARFATGTPNILSLAALDAALDLHLEVGMEAIAAAATGLIERFLDQVADLELEWVTPREAAKRGSHLSLRHPEAWRINRALIEFHQILPDFRTPDLLRIAFTPLYTTEQEVDLVANTLREVIQTKSYEKLSDERPAVT